MGLDTILRQISQPQVANTMGALGQGLVQGGQVKANQQQYEQKEQRFKEVTDQNALISFTNDINSALSMGEGQAQDDIVKGAMTKVPEGSAPFMVAQNILSMPGPEKQTMLKKAVDDGTRAGFLKPQDITDTRTAEIKNFEYGKENPGFDKIKQVEKYEKGTPYTNEEGKRVVPIYDKTTKELIRTETIGKPQEKADPVDPSKIASIGDAIIRGEQPPKIGRELGKMAGPLRAYLAERGFKQAEAMLDYNATKKHINTLNSVGQLRLAQATNFANHSLDLVVDLAEEWKGGGFAVLNKVNLAAARSGAYGEDAASLATRLSSQISDLQSELAVVYKGGNSPTDAGLEQASEQLKAEWSEKVLKDNVELIRKNLTIRQRSMKAIGVAGASSGNPYAGKQADPHKKDKPEVQTQGQVLNFDNQGNQIQ